MTQDKIEKMAIQTLGRDENKVWFGSAVNIAKFAELVAKAKLEEVATALELGPVNDTAASIAIWIREQ